LKRNNGISIFLVSNKRILFHLWTK